MKLRDYQQESIDALYTWWVSHPGVEHAPILVLPTGAGKSVVIAELTRLLFDTWPELHPRTLVIVPSKELAEQNADKLMRILPSHLSIGYYSASVGQKRPEADVIVATIGSVARAAHVLGNINCVIVDECHLISPDGAGMYRDFLNDLTKYCSYRVVGLTATPFRGNGIWLTSGKDPLFTAIAHDIKMQRLLDAGHLAPLVRPSDVIQTRVDTAGVKTTGGDYNVDALSVIVDSHIDAAAFEAVTLAADRLKWIAFTPTVANATHLRDTLRSLGVTAEIVTGDIAKKERERLITEFRAGNIRCLVTVLALATGFDVPDVDCVIWLRPTISPVLYVQGAGRGLRPSPGKTDCLWLDFTDTTQRMGPVDSIRGRKKAKARTEQDAPYAICDHCGAQVRPASALICPECGSQLREDDEKEARKASESAVMAHQVIAKIMRHAVTRVTYAVHEKEGSKDTMRVEYWSGLRIVAREWVCLEHEGFAGEKARRWWEGRAPRAVGVPRSTDRAVELIHCGLHADMRNPTAIHINESGKFPEIVKFEWEQLEEAAA